MYSLINRQECMKLIITLRWRLVQKYLSKYAADTLENAYLSAIFFAVCCTSCFAFIIFAVSNF